MASVWGIDIGKAALKAVKLRRTKEGLEIQAIEYLPYPIDDDEDERQEHVNDAIRSFLIKHKLGTDKVVIGIPGLHAFSRFISLPPVDKSKIAMMVRMEAQQQIPFPIDEVNWDWIKIDRDYMQGEEVEVGIFATRSELIDGFLADLEEHNLNPDVVTIAPLAVYNFIRHNSEDREGATIILDIGAEHTDLVILDGERFWIRNLRIAGNDVTKALAERFKIPFAEAEKLKKSSSKSQQARKIFSGMETVLKDLVGEIHRSVGFFKSQAEDLDVQRMVLLGDGSKLKNLSKFLKEQLGYPVKRISKLEQDNFVIDDSVDVDVLKNHVMGFAVAMGLAMQGANASTCSINLAPQSMQIQSALKAKVPWALAAMVCAWASLGLSYTYWDSNKGKINATIQTTSALDGYQKTQAEAQLLVNGGLVTIDGVEVTVLSFTDEIAKAEQLAGLGGGRLLVAQFMKVLGDALPKNNAKVPIHVSKALRKKDLSKQIDYVLEQDDLLKPKDERFWLLSCDIGSRSSGVGQRVVLQIAKRYSGGEGGPGRVRDDLKASVVSGLERDLADAPFYVRESSSDYGTIQVSTAKELYFLHPDAENDPGRNTFNCLMLTLTFEIGVAPEPPAPAPAEEGGE
jgi:type IV pilus assembly protein PilM